jgi:hypothetical protein
MDNNITDMNEFRRRKQSRETTRQENEDRVKGRRIEITEQDRQAMRGTGDSFTPVPSHLIHLPPVEDHERPAPPIHQVGDRVIDFRGQETGTISAVHPSNDPSKSHKVTVKTDTGYNSHNYENVWHPLHENTEVTPIDKNKK